ncbi:hypothetical protein NC651_014499 [Populus alba x Populus x berolinensis]|nr:hypothetical protein NC651_014499 [Populus alba x Populus x berolinensis]
MSYGVFCLLGRLVSLRKPDFLTFGFRRNLVLQLPNSPFFFPSLSLLPHLSFLLFGAGGERRIIRLSPEKISPGGEWFTRKYFLVLYLSYLCCGISRSFFFM